MQLVLVVVAAALLKLTFLAVFALVRRRRLRAVGGWQLVVDHKPRTTNH